MQTLLNAALNFKNSLNFKGHSSKDSFWNFFWFNIILSISFYVTSFVIPFFKAILVLYLFIGSFTFIASAITRRLHDMNKSGWFIFVTFIPIAGILFLLVTLNGESTKQKYSAPETKLQKFLKFLVLIYIALTVYLFITSAINAYIQS